MIDPTFIQNLDAWNAYCKKMYDNYNGPDAWVVCNVKLEDYIFKHTPENFYGNNHYGVRHPADQEVSPDTAVLDRAIPDFGHPINKKFCEILGLLPPARISINIQEPGGIIPPHYDTNKSTLKIPSIAEKFNELEWTDHKRYLYFWQDQEIGQFFQIGNTQIKWKAGDLIEFPFFARHTTANSSYSPRKITAITGILA